MKVLVLPLLLGAMLAASWLSCDKGWLSCEEQNSGHSARVWTYSALGRLLSYLSTEDWMENDRPADLQALEQRLSREYQDDPERVDTLIGSLSYVVEIKAGGAVELRDVWGHPLVYKPSLGQPVDAVRVYSVGPNGVDENGNRDDIEVGNFTPDEEL